MSSKVILITGGSSGIGEATALEFAKKDVAIAITYRENRVGADSVVEQIKARGGAAIAIQADLTDDRQAKDVVEEALSEFGKIDVLVNNAGRYIDGDEWDGDAAIWTKSLQQNLISVMSVSKYVIPTFIKQQSGIIVNVASRYASDGQYDALSYAAAKAGVVNITQAYAKLLTPFGRANVVSPTSVRTGYWLRAPQEEIAAQKKLIEPEAVAKKIFFLASEAAAKINGQNIAINE